MVDRPPSHHPPSLTTRCSSCGARLREKRRHARKARPHSPSTTPLFMSSVRGVCVPPPHPPSLPYHTIREACARVTGATAPIRDRLLRPSSTERVPKSTSAGQRGMHTPLSLSDRSAKRMLDKRCAEPADALRQRELVGPDRSFPDEHPRIATPRPPARGIRTLRTPDVTHGVEGASGDRRAGSRRPAGDRARRGRLRRRRTTRQVR